MTTHSLLKQIDAEIQLIGEIRMLVPRWRCLQHRKLTNRILRLEYEWANTARRLGAEMVDGHYDLKGDGR